MKNIHEIFNLDYEKPIENIIKTLKFSDEQIIKHKKGFFRILKSIIPNFSIDDENKVVISKLFDYFTGNEINSWENNIDLNKGILLCGGVGTGKSVLFEAFKNYCGEINFLNSFQFHYANDIIDSVNTKGVGVLELFNDNLSGNKPMPITCYIDDICSKNEKVKNYGTEISVIEQLISIRYNTFKKYDKLTHFSTNIYPSEMGNFYDIRIIDRLKEMCNIIELSGKSRRK